MRLTLLSALLAIAAVGLGLAGTAQAQINYPTAVFGIDAQSNPLVGWQLTGIPGGPPGSNVDGVFTTTSGLGNDENTGLPIVEKGHGVMSIVWSTGATNPAVELQHYPANTTENDTGYYSSPNSTTGNNTPWIQVSWIDNNTTGTQTSPKTEFFAGNYTAPFGTGNLNRVTGGTLFGVAYYVAERYDPGGIEETSAFTGTKASAGQFKEHTLRFEKNADGTFNTLLDGGAAYGNYQQNNNPFFATTGPAPGTAAPGFGAGTSWGIWQALEFRRRSGEVGDVAMFTDLKLGSLVYVKGDMNGDGTADNFDILPFELALTNPGAKGISGSYVDTYPLVTDWQERGDTDYGEGLGVSFQRHVINNFDILPFEQGLTGGFGPGAAVPEPSTLVLLAVGGVGLLLSRFRKGLSAKWLKVAVVLLVVSLAVSAGTAEASRIFFSTTSNSPALINPTINMSVGASASLYVFWAPTLQEDENPEQLSGWGHDIVESADHLSRTAYAYVNPTAAGQPRWSSTALGSTGGTFLADDANAVKVGGSNLGFFTTTSQGYYNVGGQDVWRLATLTFTGDTVGTSNIRLGVGTAGIAFASSPTARTINFGFDDAGISSNSFASTTTLADAVVNVVPEPGTLALLGMGVVGLAAVARKRRNAAAA